MARGTKKSQKAPKLNKGKKIEATRPLDKASISDIHFTKQMDVSSNTLAGSTSSPSK